MVRFCLLGPLRILRDGAELDLGARQRRLVLALLLARAGEPAGIRELTGLLWEQDAPGWAVNAVHRHIGELRRLLEPDLPPRAAGHFLVRHHTGYRLLVDPDSLDLLRFRALVRQARTRTRAGDPATALRHYREALDLWQIGRAHV